MQTSFTNKKALKFIITLSTGTFGSSTNNQVTLQGYRATVAIDKAGGNMASTLHAQIYGVSQSTMNSCTTLQYKPNFASPNVVQVYAIDGLQETLVFSGNIINAWGNYQSQPDAYLDIQAQHAYYAQLAPAAPLSFSGSIDVATVMGQIAASMGFTFENNAVNVQLPAGIYLANTALEQAKKLAQMAGIGLFVDDNVLAITPSPLAARGTTVPSIGPTSGLRGYPTFDGVGVTFETFFNPAIVYGGRVQLVSSLPKAAGTWFVASVGHRFESEKKDGAWFSTVRGYANGLVPGN